ncbi:protein ZINC INDUCED FACILITATOR-LIKE 1-like [Impatiens glandulifera]|uniref:protein ZINC INDUCED FACILITATOR-LIKE 1-like n=1 Tax=Impatiens glandulifera TaxID=253017 RepID=UPI001FB0D454|nr:protein ZINC INDUCED FACILITATOR-LIKE 1-like [Impatiens glandulifera]
MLGRALTSVFWGIIADRYGRKPVIIIGTITVVIFNALFGLSVNFWMAVITRFLLGSLNGLLGPIKAYSVELFNEKYQALGVSSVSTAWGIGLIIGPALGGFLAQPAEKYPTLFSKDSLFGRFPYFLPCLCISVFAFFVAIMEIWIPETLHNHSTCDNKSFEALEAMPSSPTIRNTEDMEGVKPKSESLFKNWPLMSSIIVYCIFSLHDMAYTEIFSLWAVSPRKKGGLSYSTQDVGIVLAISGLGLLIFQVCFYPFLDRKLGPVRIIRYFGALSIPLLQLYPFMTFLSGIMLHLLLNCASILKNSFSVSIINSFFLIQNKAVPQNQRGAANGIAMTGMSLFKAIGPAGGGILFSLAQKRQHAAFLPGDHIVFFVLNIIELIGVLLTFKPFLVMKN